MTHPLPDAGIVLRRPVLGLRPVRVGRGTAADTASTSVPVCASPQEAMPPAASGRAEGYADGHAEGLRAGREEGLRQAEAQARAALQDAIGEATAALREQRRCLEDRQQKLQALQASLRQAQTNVWAEAEDDMVALCFETVCRVLGPALASAEGLQAQIRQLLAASPSRAEGLALHVHPGDARVLAECGWGAESPALVADASVALGGCLLRGVTGTLDARLETILDACRRELLAARSESSVAVTP